MTTPEQVAAVAGKLSERQRKAVLASSGRRIKRGWAICRHAKISGFTIHGNARGVWCLADGHGRRGLLLTPLGLQVRDYLNKGSDAHG